MGFMQNSAKTREVIVYLYNVSKPHRFIAEETGTSRRGVQSVLKRWSGQESPNVSLTLEENVNS